MKVAVACGGTGGHVFPGLATAETLRRRGHDVVLWMGGRSVEQTTLHHWDGPVERVRAAGFPSGLSFRAADVALGLLRAVFTCRRRMKSRRPDVLLGMGSYASVGPVLAARSLGVPVVLHEANAIPGRAIAFLARFVQAVGVAFEAAATRIGCPRVVLTRLPLRGDLEARFEDGLLAPGLFTVLVMGGSQGARTLNEVTSSAFGRLRAEGWNAQVVHLTGPADEAWVRGRYAEAGLPHVVFGFLNEMGKAYGAADLAISRAGAAACMELAACHVPAVLVPLPSARRGHQMANAREMAATGGADIAAQKDFSVDWLVQYVRRCGAEPGRLQAMREALARGAWRDGADRLADLVEVTGAAGRAEAPPSGKRR